MSRDVPVYEAPITADTPGAIYDPGHMTGRGGLMGAGWRMPNASERAAASLQTQMGALPQNIKDAIASGQLAPQYSTTYDEHSGHDQRGAEINSGVTGFTSPGPNDTYYTYDLAGNNTGQHQNHHDSGPFGLGDALAHLDSSLGLSKAAPFIAAVGIGMLTAGAGSMLGEQLMSSGLLTSAEAASTAVLEAGGTQAAATAAGTAATTTATTVGTVVANTGLQIATGASPEKALANGALSLFASQYINPAVASEVKQVFSDPTVVNMATNMGTATAQGVLTGQSPDNIAKGALGAATGTLINRVSQDVGQKVLSNIDDPDIGRIAANAAAAGTRAVITGKDPTTAIVSAAFNSVAQPYVQDAKNVVKTAFNAALSRSDSGGGDSTDESLGASFGGAGNDTATQLPPLTAAAIDSLTGTEGYGVNAAATDFATDSGADTSLVGSGGSGLGHLTPAAIDSLTGTEGYGVKEAAIITAAIYAPELLAELGGSAAIPEAAATLGASEGAITAAEVAALPGLSAVPEGIASLVAPEAITGALPVAAAPTAAGTGALVDAGALTGAEALTAGSAPGALAATLPAYVAPTAAELVAAGTTTGGTLSTALGNEAVASGTFTPGSLGAAANAAGVLTPTQVLAATGLPGLTSLTGADALAAKLAASSNEAVASGLSPGSVGAAQAAAGMLTPAQIAAAAGTLQSGALPDLSIPKAPATKTSGNSNLMGQGLNLINNTTNAGGGSYPQALQGTGLSSQAPTGQSDLLKQLVQLYPQMSNVNPQTMAAISPYYHTQQIPQVDLPAEEPQYYAKGGLSHHRPEFITGATGHYVKGRGDGQSDDIPAMLADGEYVFDADTVASLGNGSSDAGAKRLDEMREAIRKHKRSAPIHKIPPKAKSPLEYLKG